MGIIRQSPSPSVNTFTTQLYSNGYYQAKLVMKMVYQWTVFHKIERFRLRYRLPVRLTCHECVNSLYIIDVYSMETFCIDAKICKIKDLFSRSF